MSDAEETGEARRDEDARLLAGRYRLGQVLGRGGMGTVWRALDETLGRTVAVKELRFPSSIDEDEKRRLITRTLREAKAIARIRNTSAVTVYDVVDEDDRPWIVMELVEGKSLAEVIREDGLLTPARAAEVGLAVLDVLRSAHREGILHRDVKPSNVLIAEDGRVVLTDFGIAQVEGDPSITSTGMLVGAPSYISPERARGHRPGPAADLWSLGGLLYAAVEGVPPYDKGSAIATLTAVMTEPLEKPKHAGPLEPVIYGLLAKDPEQRLDDAGARARLTEVINTPKAPEAPAKPADSRTRALPLPPAPDEGGDKPAETPADTPAEAPAAPAKKTEERLRGALRSVRKAAAAATPAAAKPREVPPPPGTPPATPAPAATASGTPEAPAAPAGGQQPQDPRKPSTPERTTVSPASAPAAPAAPAAPPPGRPPRASLFETVPRRTVALVVAVVVLAVIGIVLGLTLGGDDGDKKGDTSASSSPTAGDDEGHKGGGQDTDGGKGKPSDTPSSSASQGQESEGGQGATPGHDDSPGGSGSEPEGVSSHYTDGQGFSIGLPKGWKHTGNDTAGARFAGPDGQKLLVGWTDKPKSDPVADWEEQSHHMVKADYHTVSIKPATYRDWLTADWEFTYTEGGTKLHSVDRGFVVNSHLGYGLLYTARDHDWDGDHRADTWKTLTDSFEPKS